MRERSPGVELAQRALSSRELQVLEMAAQGLTNAEIAARLAVTVHAIKFHLGSVYRKLGVSNRTEAAITLVREQQGTVI